MEKQGHVEIIICSYFLRVCNFEFVTVVTKIRELCHIFTWFISLFYV